MTTVFARTLFEKKFIEFEDLMTSESSYEFS